MIWSEHGSGAVRRLDVDGNVTELYRLPPPLYDLKLVSDTERQGEPRPAPRPTAPAPRPLTAPLLQVTTSAR